MQWWLKTIVYKEYLRCIWIYLTKQGRNETHTVRRKEKKNIMVELNYQ